MPDRQVPTRPGWWWRDDPKHGLEACSISQDVFTGSLEPLEWCSENEGGVVEDDGRWLAEIPSPAELAQLQADSHELQARRARAEMDAAELAALRKCAEVITSAAEHHGMNGAGPLNDVPMVAWSIGEAHKAIVQQGTGCSGAHVSVRTDTLEYLIEAAKVALTALRESRGG